MNQRNDRRDFLKATGGAAIAASLAGTGMVNSSDVVAKENDKTEGKKMKIEVNHEWGTLKEVVVGIPHVYVPKPMPASVENWVPAENWKYYKSMEGKTIREGDPKHYAKMAKQMDDAIAILEKRGVIVYRPKQLTKEETNYLGEIYPASVLQGWPRDTMIVIGNSFIEPSLYIPLRRRERFGIRRAVEERLYNSNAKIVSMPPPVPLPEAEDGSYGPGPFLEGGDTFLIGRDIYVGISGNASNSAGARWLQQYLGKEYRVHEVRLTKKWLHLDCCLATPRPGLALACREAFVDGLPDFLKDWTIIDVSYEDAHERLGCNGLVLDDKSMMVDTHLPKVAKALRKEGVEVIETPFDAVYRFGGAFRCWHHPLVRESELESA